MPHLHRVLPAPSGMNTGALMFDQTYFALDVEGFATTQGHVDNVPVATAMHEGEEQHAVAGVGGAVPDGVTGQADAGGQAA